MTDACYNSVQALASAILNELAKAENNSQHNRIRISYDIKNLRNGITCCSVQIQCSAGCGWLIEACDMEAEALRRNASAVQSLLQDKTKDASTPLAEILLTVFPEFMPGIKSAKGAQESNLGGRSLWKNP